MKETTKNGLTKIYLILIIFLCSLLCLSKDGFAQHIHLPPDTSQIQVSYLKKIPLIDGIVSFSQHQPWIPVLNKNKEEKDFSVSFWYKLEWNEKGVYIAAALPHVNLRSSTPFEVVLNLNLHPKWPPGTSDNYKLEFRPLIKEPSKMLYESQAFKFNHYLGSGSRLTDPGLVIWHELSLSHISPQGVQARWAKMKQCCQEGDGLSFEAFISWKSMSLDGAPKDNQALFNIHVRASDQSMASWSSGTQKKGVNGGQMLLLKPGEVMDIDLYYSDTIGLQSFGNVVVQEELLTVGLPLIDRFREVKFTLANKKGRLIQNLETKTHSNTNALKVQVKIPDVPDGKYYIQVRDGKSEKIIIQKPFYLAQTLISQEIINYRKQLFTKLKYIQSKSKKVWQNGYLAKAKWLLKQVKVVSPVTIDYFNQTAGRLSEVKRILIALEQNERPEPTSVNYYRPSGFIATGQRGPVKFVPTKGKASLIINASDITPWEVSPLIYGTFSEPVFYDRPVYGMIYSQKLRNISFEWGHPTFEETMNQFVDVYHEIDAVSARQVRRGDWVSVQSTDENEVAAPWIGIGTGDIDFSLTRESFNSKMSQKITNFSEDGEAGVAQLISLPIWRETTYHFKGHFRMDGELHSVHVKLYYKGNVVDQVLFNNITSQWKTFKAALKLPKKKQELQNGFLLSISFEGKGSLYVDQVTLFPADAIGGLNPQIVKRLRKFDPEWIRWPGGNFASGYHWKEGIGPFKNRIASPNPSWPGLPSNLFGTDEYMNLVEELNLEPFITVNAGNGTPKEAADWVEYTNGSISTDMGSLRAKNGHPTPYNVTYWNIGNELWGSWQVGYCTPYEYVKRYQAFTKAMGKRDSTLRFVASGVGPFSLGPKLWTDMLLDSVQVNLDIIDFHAYMGVPSHRNFGEASAMQILIDMPIAFEQGLMAFRKKAVEKGREDLKVIVGEYNTSTWNMPPEKQSTAQLLTYAGWLHGFIRQGKYVIGANATEYSIFDPRALMMGTLHPRNKLFKLYHDKAGNKPVQAVLKTPVRQDPYQYPFQISKNVVPIFNMPIIDAVVLKNEEEGYLSVGLINRDLQDTRKIEFNLNGYQMKSDVIQYILWDDEDGTHPITVKKKNIAVSRDFTISLPPGSVSLVIIYKK